MCYLLHYLIYSMLLYLPLHYNEIKLVDFVGIEPTPAKDYIPHRTSQLIHEVHKLKCVLQDSNLHPEVVKPLVMMP